MGSATVPSRPSRTTIYYAMSALETLSPPSCRPRVRPSGQKISAAIVVGAGKIFVWGRGPHCALAPIYDGDLRHHAWIPGWAARIARPPPCPFGDKFWGGRRGLAPRWGRRRLEHRHRSHGRGWGCITFRPHGGHRDIGVFAPVGARWETAQGDGNVDYSLLVEL